MDKNSAFGKIAARYREISDREWAEFVDLIKTDMAEFKRRWKAWEMQHRRKEK